MIVLSLASQRELIPKKKTEELVNKFALFSTFNTFEATS